VPGRLLRFRQKQSSRYVGICQRHLCDGLRPLPVRLDGATVKGWLRERSTSEGQSQPLKSWIVIK
jgi:hypothetical protein